MFSRIPPLDSVHRAGQPTLCTAIIYKNRENVKSRSKDRNGKDRNSGNVPAWYIIESMPNASTMLIIECIKAIPPGMVLSYGDVARMAGYPGGGLGARQVARILASMSAKYDLPWWRVVKKDGSIALGSGHGAELQAERLRQEGVPFIAPGKVDMRRSMYST